MFGIGFVPSISVLFILSLSLFITDPGENKALVCCLELKTNLKITSPESPPCAYKIPNLPEGIFYQLKP